MLGGLKYTGTRRLPDDSYPLLNLGEIAESSRGLSEATPTDTFFTPRWACPIGRNGSRL